MCEEQCITATHQTAPCLHQLGGVRGVCERVCEEQCNTAGPFFFHGFLRPISRAREIENDAFHGYFTG